MLLYDCILRQKTIFLSFLTTSDLLIAVRTVPSFIVRLFHIQIYDGDIGNKRYQGKIKINQALLLDSVDFSGAAVVILRF